MQATALTNIRIWDGDDLLDADTIRIEGDRIAGIGGRSDLIDDARVMDCAGATALPGLIDAHVHLELNPDHHKPPETTDLGQRPLMVERAAAMVQAGITTARDLGGGAWLELELRDRIAGGEINGPRLLCSGQPITCPQGHCHFWGGEAANVEEAKAVLARQVGKGVDLIKVMATGGRMTRGSDPLKPQFDLATLSEITATARALNLTVAAHCHGTAGIEVAARAGVRTIEHCSWVGADGWASDFQGTIAQLILDKGVWVSPTVNKGWQRMLDSKTGDVLTRVRSAYRHMLDMGIPFVASTDAGIPGVFHH
ncbi:MAG: amidohydrolase family protein, partial [Gammaproteobacteria bacterium]|nr:amidohydrolase family protein [Gammaproteobacteria bacterium]